MDLRFCLLSSKKTKYNTSSSSKGAFWTFLLFNVCEKVLGTVHVCVTGQRLDGAACRHRGTGTFTLNSNQAVSGAGSGIVAGPWQGQRCRQEAAGGGGWAAGTAAALGVTGCYPRRVGVGSVHEKQRGGRGPVLADFHGVQMLNMQMSDRIVRRWIGSPYWLAWGQSPAAVQGSAVVSRAPPDKMSSRSQAAHWTCELELDFT